MSSNSSDPIISKVPVLHAAWKRNAESIEALRQAVEASAQFDAAPEQRARAYHQLVEAQAIAYNFAIAPRLSHPRIYHNTAWQTDVYCSGGNGPDFHYGTVFLDGTQTYRLKVKVNDSQMLLAQHNSALPGTPGSRMVGNYDFQDFEINADGSFEVILSAEKVDGNWIPLVREAGYQWLLFRPSIEGWDRQPADVAIERISPIKPGHYDDDEFADENLARRIDMATDFARYVVEEWMLAFYQRVVANSQGENIFKTIGPAISGEVGSPTAEYVFCAFDVADDEALIIELTDRPNGIYWGIQLFDVWLRSITFPTRQSTLNSNQVHVDDDGAIRMVVSRQDTGVANWLDSAGYRKGQLLIRNYRSTYPAKPTIERVKLADLDQHLPASTRRVTADERTADLARRRATYLKRHGE